MGTDIGFEDIPDAFLSLIETLVHSNILISVSATSVAVSTIILAELSIDSLPLFIVFAAAMFVYSYNRISDFTEDKQNIPKRASFVEQYGKGLLAIGGLLYFLATSLAIQQSISGAPAMVIPLLVAVLYSVVGLKRVLLVKNLLVGFSWGLIPAGVGVYYDVLWTTDILFMTGFITATLTIAAAVFDIKDIEGDSEAGIATLPVLYGPAVTRQLSTFATVIISLLVVVLVLIEVLRPVYLLLCLYTAYMIGYCFVATTDKGPLFYGFVIDAEHIVLALLLLAQELLSRGVLSS
ncbi:UbiA family prenyltransferase [Halovenus rubra]|uniref:UbiA family prenyltransferase n=2 Tax=Halovenus rubra TaxID=869890 RepID=A0ACC7E129_9EURY|nr:UbiA family prenyltransferase [Halovenus rubra]